MRSNLWFADVFVAPVALGVFQVIGCTGSAVDLTETSSPSDGAPVDQRREFPPPPPGGIQLLTPDFVVPARSEIQVCVAVPYDGPTVGISGQVSYQSPGGHHVTVNGTYANEEMLPDGVEIDCSGDDTDLMVSIDPLIIGGQPQDSDDGPEYALTLPDGMAARLPEGSRLMLQSHYVNATADPILVHDAVNLALVPEDEVDVWAAPYALSEMNDLALPIGPSVIESDCVVEDPVSVLFLGGHMHQWGTSFATLRNQDELLYEVPEWDPLFRDAPMYADLGAGLDLVPGDVLTTRCAYDNTTDHELRFPEEMCVTFTMVYPATRAVVCDGT